MKAEKTKQNFKDKVWKIIECLMFRITDNLTNYCFSWIVGLPDYIDYWECTLHLYNYLLPILV